MTRADALVEAAGLMTKHGKSLLAEYGDLTDDFWANVMGRDCLEIAALLLREAKRHAKSNARRRKVPA